jgi:hypothetical protein
MKNCGIVKYEVDFFSTGSSVATKPEAAPAASEGPGWMLCGGS